MEFVVPDLPYKQNALDPVISQRTVEFHYGKHHAGYVNKLKDALPESEHGASLEEIILDSHRKENASVFNPAAQVWNHTFYWNSMTPDPVDIEDDQLKGLIASSFGDKDGLLEAFKNAAVAQFGSGWAWLLYDKKSDALKIQSTSDAANPLPTDLTPLLTIDVWEHAYYLDYQHERARYIDGFLDKLINWQFAAENLKR